MAGKVYGLNPETEIIFDPDESGLALENPLRNEIYKLSGAKLLELLDELTTPVSESEILATVSDEYGLTEEKAREVLRDLVERGIVLEEDHAQEGNEWREYGWGEALSYYKAIRNYPFVDYSEGKDAFDTDFGRMQEYRDEEPVPSVYKTYPDAELHDLPDPNGELLPDVETVLAYNPGPDESPLTRQQLSSILYFTFGETGRVSFPHQGEFLLKTSPSGGARHPTEAYVAALDVGGVDRGLYHYSVKEHGLEQLQPDIKESELESIVFGLRDVDYSPKAVVFFTSALERSQWRYREPRTYSVILNDIGHLIETFRLLANGFGRHAVFGHGFEDSELSDLLGTDLYTEPPFRFCSLS